jgi:alpha-L-rhamnosidase
VKIKELYVESRRSPLGIDVRQPNLSWSFENSERRSIMQTAYRIMVSNDEQAVLRGQGTIWDSEKVDSRKNVNIVYEGCKLDARKRYFWKIQVWDQTGRMYESHVSWWEMGLLDPADWTSQWIGYAESASDYKPLPQFRKDFSIEQSVSRARIYISGMGQYELTLNGHKLDDRVLDPGWTRYDQTCLYAVYDITDHLSIADHTVGVMLGNGFFNVSGGRYTKFKDSFGLPKCRVQIEIDFADGSSAMINSDKRWMASSSPLTFSCIYGGEDYDARLEQSGWDRPGFALNDQWNAAVVVEPPAGKLSSQKTEPLKIMQTFKPVDIKQLKPNMYIFDLGQNFSGWIKIAVKGKRDACIKMLPGEILNDDGTVSQKSTGSPYELNYILKGGEVETWSPRFTYSGFRYIQIEGALPEGFAHDNLPTLLSIEGQMIYPEINISGSFESSDAMINKIHEIINWAVLSNMKSVFTDCPHREKLGWLEQVHLMGPSMMYNYPIESLLTKVMDDIQDAQLPNGMVPTTAPEYVVFEKPWDIFRHSVSWAATYILSPWHMYQKYGNTRILLDHYEGMKRYIEYVISQSEGYIVKDGLGDWYDVHEEGPGFTKNTPVALPETAMFYSLVQTIQQIAAVIDKEQDADKYATLGNHIKNAYNQTFFNPESYQYATGSQASNAMSLAMNMVEEPYRSRVFENLVNDFVAHDYHTTAGDVAHRYVLLALAENGRSDIIFEMTRQTDHPSYGYQIEHGATTLTEAWDGPTVGHSQNHFMLGHIEEWFYSGLAGFNYEFNPSLQSYQFKIKPSAEKEISYIKVRQDLLMGKSRMEWEHNDRLFKLDVEIPVNCSAVIYVPAASINDVQESGKPVQDVHDIQFEGMEDGFALLRVNSGYYRFLSVKQ